MLIKCPECGKEISDKAKQCIHCGFPLLDSKTADGVDAVSGKKYNVFLMPMEDENVSYHNIERLISEFSPYSKMEIEYLLSTKGRALLKSNLTYDMAQDIQLRFREASAEIIIEEMSNNIKIHSGRVMNTPTCPKCGSTAITTGPRGVNFTWGLIGASKTVNRCANCGHTWKPRK